MRVRDVNELVQTVFSGLSPLVIEDVADEGKRIVVAGTDSAEHRGLPGVQGLVGTRARLSLADRRGRAGQ